ncbi:zinc finger protein 572-like [Armigeres subalbatus]|uniref:zinc finger protein 572-like n=1 Tax=Armigeres subalbatus TaxID=124917 RepID=UPI002ED10593
MLSDWRSWCRLCANECANFKLELLDELNEITMRHFKFSLQELNDVCNCICEECYNFINKLDVFKERCLKTSKLLVELCATCIDDEELLESDIQDLRFRYLSDSILTDVDVEHEEKPLLHDTAHFIQEEPSTNSEQADNKNDLLGQNLVQLKIEKIPIKQKRSASRETTILSNGETENDRRDMLEHIVEDDRLLTDLSVVTLTKLSSDVPLIDDVSDNDGGLDDHQDDDYALDELEYDSQTEADVVHASKKIPKRKISTNNIKAKPIPKTKCELCDKSFRTRSLYVMHLQNKHPSSDELMFTCTLCPKRFPSERKAKLHALVHLPSDQKLVHPCKYCDKKFSKLVNVQAHIKAVHIGERPYICEECGKAFGTKGALKEHQITHSDEKPYQCAHCPKKFKNLPRLKTHEDIHNATLYVCPHCGLQLNTKRTLKMHMVVHSDQKKFKCQYCGNEYKRSKALKNHLILHTGLRPYQCPFCEKTFANGSNCRSHKKKAHPKELALLEASGGQSRATNIPKLDQLQPKPHQSTSLPGTQTATPATVVLVQQPTDTSIAPLAAHSASIAASQQQQPKPTTATIIATPSPTLSSRMDASNSEELMLHRGVRLVTAYIRTQNEPPPLNILPTTANIKHDEVNGGAASTASVAVAIGERQHTVMDQGRRGGAQTLVIRKQESSAAVPPLTEPVQLSEADMADLPSLQLITTNNL